MKRQSIIGLFALTLVLLVSACKKNDFETTDNGLKYKYIVKSDTGEVAGVGGYLEMHIKMEGHIDSLDVDTILTNTYTDGYGPAKMMVAEPTYDGCINEGFAMLRAGDSVIFTVLCDSLYGKTFNRPGPPFLTGKEMLTVTVKVLQSKSKETFDKEQKEEQEKQAKATQELLTKEQAQLKEVAEKMGYSDKLELSPSGMYYVKLKETNGPTANQGDVGSFYYKGTFVDGTEFESNFDSEPFNVTIGSGGAIAGWLEVVDRIKLGETWKLFIPSSLAYGARGSGKIGPNTPLIFEIKLGAIRSAEEVKKEQEARMKKLSEQETKKLNTYLKGKDFKQIENQTLYYQVVKEGTGEMPKAGDNIKVKINGFDLDEKPIGQFSMQDPPIETTFGQNGLPYAMETILKMTKVGGIVKVVTPSRHFQGEQGGGVVAPYTPILIEMELVSVEKAK